VNFYFAPGYGYYRAPAQYRDRDWYPGDYLPSFYLRYRVHDASFYGLPYAPRGCAWVYVDNDIVLVDLRDGYVIDVYRDVWWW